ncbi:MAG: glycosyl hydrolase family 2, partial [Bacteroidetes bacterium]
MCKSQKMKRFSIYLFAASFFLLLFGSCNTNSNNPEIPAEISKEAKPWAYWWWMGNSVSPEGITANLEKYSKAGMGGLHIVPIYGEKGDEENFIQYVSPEWMEMLKHAVAEAERLNMG